MFIPEYAKNFNKELFASDIKFYGKTHFDRNCSNNGLNMHCHLIISRKDQANKKKLSPLTNHKNTKNGVIKGGFNRVNLFQQVEQKFDRLFNYKRQQTESFDYQNIMKNGSISDQLNLNKQSIISSERNNQINKEYTVENRRVVNQENNQATNSFISLFSSNSDSFTKLQEQRPKKKKRKRRL